MVIKNKKGNDNHVGYSRKLEKRIEMKLKVNNLFSVTCFYNASKVVTSHNVR